MPTSLSRKATAPVPSEKRRASDTIAQELRRLIVSGEIVSGGHLQPTAALIERFGVSRPTMLEAFRILENEQLISVRHGSRSGVQVLGPSTDAATRMAGQSLQATGATIGDLYEALIGFEPYAARLVAERHDRRDIAALRAQFARLEGTLAAGLASRHGVELARFHHLLVELTGNKVMMLMADLIAVSIERHQEVDYAERYRDMPEAEMSSFRSSGVRSIAKLIRMVEAGDAEGAEAHWRRHVINANEFWLRGKDRHEQVNLVR